MIRGTEIPTFGQRMGLEPIPTQLKTTEVTPQLQSLVWRAIFESMAENVYAPPMGGPAFIIDRWKEIMQDFHTDMLHFPADEFSNYADDQRKIAKGEVYAGSYIRLYNFVQFIISHPQLPYRLDQTLAGALVAAKAPFRIERRMVLPFASEHEAAALVAALDATRQEEFGGAHSHLVSAAQELTAGQWSDSIRHSIHAVESIARVLEPSADSLGQALAKLQKSERMNGGLRSAATSLYGYSSSVEGIRHALVFQSQASVDEADAVFMLGACASFVTYIIKKGGLTPTPSA